MCFFYIFPIAQGHQANTSSFISKYFSIIFSISLLQFTKAINNNPKASLLYLLHYLHYFCEISFFIIFKVIRKKHPCECYLMGKIRNDKKFSFRRNFLLRLTNFHTCYSTQGEETKVMKQNPGTLELNSKIGGHTLLTCQFCCLR